MLLEELIDVFKKTHPDMDEHEFFAMITADPTIVTNDRGSFCGRYCTWIGNQYVDGKIKVGDAPELRSALVIYDKNKSQLKPIKEVKDLDELINLVKDLSDDFKPTRRISKGEQGLEKVYEDDEWVVYIPHTFEASRKIGGDTRWCTAASNGQERFDYYTSKGPLYVNIRKSDGEKFQFHFETNQFMDRDDRHHNIKQLNLNNNIIKFYNHINEDFKLMLIYDSVYNKSCGYRVVKLNGKYNFINDNNILMLNEWQDWEYASEFREDAMLIRQNKMYNYINTNGQLLIPNYWFDAANNFKYGHAAVNLNGKWNLININGQFVMPNQWFDYPSYIGYGFYSFFIDGQLFILNGKSGGILTQVTI